MITRRKDYTKHAPSKDASKIYIVCEGAETEKGYFNFFEGLSWDSAKLPWMNF